MHGAKVWSLTSKTQSSLQAAEMRVLRLIKRVTKLNKCRNADIKEELGVGSLLDEIKAAI